MKDFLVHINMGEIGYVIKAKTKEEAAEKATNRAAKLVTKGTCSHIHPRVVRIEGEEYKAPPLKVRLK